MNSSRVARQSLAVLRVRDRWLIKVAVEQQYSSGSLRTASWAPPMKHIEALAQSLWVTREGSSDKEAAMGIIRGVKRLLDLLKRAPGRVWEAFSRALDLPGLENKSILEKIKLLGGKIKDLLRDGQKALKIMGAKIKSTFPLSLYFVEKNKAPGLTDILTKIAQKSPKIWALLQKIKGGAMKVDKVLDKYLPTLKRPLLAALFIVVWINVAEISWDIDGLIAGFTGAISFTELLSSLPESGIGLLLAMMGLGYGALPVTIVLRIMWLVANRYLEWIPGKGLRVKWELMGIPQSDELVTV